MAPNMLPWSVIATAGILIFDGLRDQFFDTASAVKEAVLGVQVQMDKIRWAHALSLEASIYAQRLHQ